MSERPETREGFGEAGLGDAQAENPPADPEMIESSGDGDDKDGDGERPAEGGTEKVGGDQDAEPASTPDEPQPDKPEG